jgi:TPR repeat protein
MQIPLAWKSLQRLALLALALAWTAPLHAQPQQQGLHVGSPQAVLNDPIVKRCRMLAARRVDPTLDSLTTAVDQAAVQFNIAPVFEAVAACRAALAAYPNEPKVIVAQYNASEALSVLALGLKFPESDEQALATALQAAEKEWNASGLNAQLLDFFLGSAYEYGAGTAPDRAAAIKWYTRGANAGDPISKRELARLQSSQQ